MLGEGGKGGPGKDGADCEGGGWDEADGGYRPLARIWGEVNEKSDGPLIAIGGPPVRACAWSMRLIGDGCSSVDFVTTRFVRSLPIGPVTGVRPDEPPLGYRLVVGPLSGLTGGGKNASERSRE